MTSPDTSLITSNSRGLESSPDTEPVSPPIQETEPVSQKPVSDTSHHQETPKVVESTDQFIKNGWVVSSTENTEDYKGEWGLELCPVCNQMTNHDDDGCLKCRSRLVKEDTEERFSIKLQEITADTDMTDTQFIKMLNVVQSYTDQAVQAFGEKVLKDPRAFKAYSKRNPDGSTERVAEKMVVPVSAITSLMNRSKQDGKH